MEDLVQEGALGLVKAVERFDPERGLRFSTFASWWIRATIQRAVAAKSRTIRLPHAKFALLTKAKRAHDRLQQENGRAPDEAELASELAVTLPQLRSVLRHWQVVGSVEAPMLGASAGMDGSTNSGSLIECVSVRPIMGRQLPPEEGLERNLVSKALRRQLDEALSPLEADVLRLRYGLDNGTCLPWRQIAERCDTPVRELQALQTRAFRRLRKTDEVSQLLHFCHHDDWDAGAMG